jgi:hypothetical protein
VALLLGSWRPVRATADEFLHPVPSPGAPEWTDQTFPRIARHTLYQVVETTAEVGARSAVAYHASSQCAASGKIVPMAGVDLIRTPILSWSWKIVRGLDIVDEQTRRGDDFAARVYVLFGFDAESASIRERLIHRISSRLFRRAIPGSALNYVFASRLAAGTTWPNPSESDTHMVALRTGSVTSAAPADSTASWHHESVDVLADHGRLIAPTLRPEVVAVALMTDTDSTCSAAEALYAGFRFHARAADPPPS